MVANHETGRYKCVNCGNKVGIIDAVVAAKVAEKDARIAAIESELAEAKKLLMPVCYHCGNVRVYPSTYTPPDCHCHFGKNPPGTRCPYCDDWLGRCAAEKRAESAEARAEQTERACVVLMDSAALEGSLKTTALNPDVAAVRDRLKGASNG